MEQSFIKIFVFVPFHGNWIVTVSVFNCMETDIELESVFKSILQIQLQIVQNVEQFVTDVLPNRVEDEVHDTHETRSDLFQYVVGMILFLWHQKNYNLESILRGLHKQSLMSLHAYLCPDLEMKGAPEQTNTTLDPYKDAIKELQQLSDDKPRKCQFCHKESVFSYVSAQTRSADEGMTTFVTCSLCGKRQRL